jgi:O-Antigen ligase
MAGHDSLTARRRHPAVAGWATAGAVGLVAVGVLASAPAPPVGLAVAMGVAGAGVLWLALARYDVAVFVGIALSAVVPFEPAPADALLVLVVVVGLLTGRFDLGRVPVTIVALLGAFLTLNAASMLTALDHHEALLFFAITAYVVVLAIWLTSYVTSPARARAVMLAYAVAAVATAIVGTLALVAPLPGRNTLLYGGCCRAEAFLRDPNVMGPFLVPVVLVLLEETLRPRLWPGRRALKLAALAALGAGVLVSYSRAAWLDLGVGVLVLLLVLVLRPRGGRAGAALLAAVATLVMAAGAFLALTGSEAFLRERATSHQAYDTERFATQRAGLRLAADHPFGIGPGQFDLYEPISAHSTYVRVLAEQGPIGFLVLMAVLGVTLAMAVDNAAAGRSTWGIGSAALLGAWCGALANSFFIDTLHWRHLWLVAALIWAGAMRRSYVSSRAP